MSGADVPETIHHALIGENVVGSDEIVNDGVKGRLGA
jgi:hypothetical protein